MIQRPSKKLSITSVSPANGLLAKASLIKPEIFNLEQGTEEWFAVRRGIPTSSRFEEVLRQKGRGDDGKSITRRLYINQIAGEIITGETMISFKNEAIQRGHDLEDRARGAYTYQSGLQVDPVGFIRRGRYGASTDGLIGEDGLLEIKTAEPHILIDILRKQKAPDKHLPQIQGGLAASGRKWCDLCIYCGKPGLPAYIERFHRDQTYIDELEGQIYVFNREVDSVVEHVRSFGC